MFSGTGSALRHLVATCCFGAAMFLGWCCSESPGQGKPPGAAVGSPSSNPATPPLSAAQRKVLDEQNRAAAGRPDRWRAGRMGGSTPHGGWADRANEFITHGTLADGTGSVGPCHTNCANTDEVYSFHSGGANHVFADGSVHFIRSDMPIRLFVKLLSRQGEDVISTDF